MKTWVCACPGCGHEWQGERNTCDWCGTDGKLLEDKPAPAYRKLIEPLLKRHRKGDDL